MVFIYNLITIDILKLFTLNKNRTDKVNFTQLWKNHLLLGLSEGLIQIIVNILFKKIRNKIFKLAFQLSS